MKRVYLFVFSLSLLLFSSAHAMQPKSAVLSLQNLAMMQLAAQDDAVVLRLNLEKLSNDLALALLLHVMSFNFDLSLFAKAELAADFKKRKGLSKALKDKLAELEKNLLRGNSHEILDTCSLALE